MCWTSLYANIQKQLINKTQALLQTTGGKDEPNWSTQKNHRAVASQ